jgi:hypothetical protein
LIQIGDIIYGSGEHDEKQRAEMKNKRKLTAKNVSLMPFVSSKPIRYPIIEVFFLEG